MIEEAKKKSAEDDYNPFEHRVVKKPNTDVRSAANLIKSSLGSGLLAMPLAFSNAGWGVGLVATLIISFICGHCVHILVKTSRGCCRLEKKPLLSYAETCESAFANGPRFLRPLATSASVFTELALALTYLAVCCVYTVLIADSIKQLVDTYVPSIVLPVQQYCLILLIPLAMISQIKYLKWLAPFSMIANVLLVFIFIICLYYIFSGNMTFENRRVVGDMSRLPAYLSTVIFAMEGVGVVMPTENTMAKPQHFLGCFSVLTVSMAIITFLYTALGFLGYLRYGDISKGSVTLNLPIGEWPAVCAKVFIIIAIFFTYALQFYIPIDIFWKHVGPRVTKRYHGLTQVTIRIVAVCICGAIAIALPMLEQIIAIVGAFFYSILGLIIPAVIETVFRYNDLGKWNWVLWKNILLLLFGFGALISGNVVAIMDIVEILHKQQ